MRDKKRRRKRKKREGKKENGNRKTHEVRGCFPSKRKKASARHRVTLCEGTGSKNKTRATTKPQVKRNLI